MKPLDELQCADETIFAFNKLVKSKYDLRSILSSSSCQNHFIKYCETIYESDGINLSWSIKISNEFLNKFKSKGFKASKVSTYNLHTVYYVTTSPY